MKYLFIVILACVALCVQMAVTSQQRVLINRLNKEVRQGLDQNEALVEAIELYRKTVALNNLRIEQLEATLRGQQFAHEASIRSIMKQHKIGPVTNVWEVVK